MPAQMLSDDFVFHLACPAGRAHFEVFDTLCRGLYVDVFPSGRMAFRLRYRWQEGRRVLTLGDARLLTVDEAREQARCALRAVLAERDPRMAMVGGPTLEEFFRLHYMPFVRSYKRSWSSDDSLVRNHLLPHLGGQAMGGLLALDAARVVESMRSRGYAVGTVNRVLVLLRHAFALALRWRIEGVAQNPLKELKNLKGEGRLERYLTPEQSARLLVAVRRCPNALLAPIVAFLIYTGARKREALDARWQDIDWQRRLWSIPRTKSGKVRHVPLSAGALAVLRERQVVADPAQEYVFANPRTGLPFVTVFNGWHRARCVAGLPQLRIHDLRHSFASFLVNAGRSLYEVQELLGHSDIRTTSRYAHLSQERLREAVESVPVAP